MLLSGHRRNSIWKTNNQTTICPQRWTKYQTIVSIINYLRLTRNLLQNIVKFKELLVCYWYLHRKKVCKIFQGIDPTVDSDFIFNVYIRIKDYIFYLLGITENEYILSVIDI